MASPHLKHQRVAIVGNVPDVLAVPTVKQRFVADIWLRNLADFALFQPPFLHVSHSLTAALLAPVTPNRHRLAKPTPSGNRRVMVVTKPLKI